MKYKSKRTAAIGKRANSIGIAVTAAAAVICMGLALWGGMSERLDTSGFAQTIMINGKDVSGMEYSEASEILTAEEQEKIDAVEIPIEYNGHEIKLDAENMGLTSDLQDKLDEAYEIGRNTHKSIFENYDDLKIAEKIRSFESVINFDEATLQKTLDRYLAQSDIEPVDATAKFDKETHEFTYTDSEAGTKADREKLYAQIMSAFENGSDDELQVFGEVVQPEITRAELEDNTVSIGKCVTIASYNENRNTNIRLMCEAVNGIKLDPGQTLSINELVGQRTKEKGFKEAPAIMDGKRLENDVGGGICQMSGTLYNAALRADMEIVERVRHSFPSTYLPIGLDATLNWDDKDLKIRNTSEWPMYIGVSFDDQRVSVEIFGQPPKDGMEIEIRTEMLKETDPGDPEVIYTDEFAPGIRKVKSNSHKGYDVDVYRDDFLNNELVKSELISQDRFPAIKAVVLEGTGDTQK